MRFPLLLLTAAALSANAIADAGVGAKPLPDAELIIDGSRQLLDDKGGAEVPAQPGHSLHGEAFNDGPRQTAQLIEGTGKVDFPITTANELAAKFFNQGVGQLHGFWYFEAERSFRQVAALDPECAMAYWGMAMANINNQKRAAAFMKKATAGNAKASRREQLWIKAWDEYYVQTKADEQKRRQTLVKVLEDISYEFPADLEAKAFLVFQIWDNKSHGVPIPSRQAVDALAQQVLAANPMHPGASHYLIHLWNTDDTNQRALTSAARCGQAAPAIAHMWHMPGHTFSGMKRYADAAWQMEASARVDHAQMIANQIIPDQIHNFAHNNAWLIQDLRHIGRAHDAVDLAKNMIELPRLGSKSGNSYKLGRDELLKTLLQFELWDEVSVLETDSHLAAFGDPLEEIRRLRLLGLAAMGLSKIDHGGKQIDALVALQAETHKLRVTAANEAEAKAKSDKKSEADIVKAIGIAMRSFSYRMETIESAIAELRAMRALAENQPDEAKKQIELAKDIPAERLSRIRFALGQKEDSIKLARDASKADEKQVQPLANLADLLWRNGNKEDALATFKQLHELSAELDLDVPVFARLKPIAIELNLGENWRIAPNISADSGIRPDLSGLGPFRWRPSPAPAWTLPDGDLGQRSLADYRGRPVLVMFYLGSGCSHCIEQLNVFGPLTKQFSDLGISIIAVSTDTPSGLCLTFAKSKEATGFSFPIVSDQGLETFKAYKAYDDFEKIPLHGTFLVDGSGLIRWQDIGFEPFRDGKWLLEEAKRLLSFPGVPVPKQLSVISCQ